MTIILRFFNRWLSPIQCLVVKANCVLPGKRFHRKVAPDGMPIVQNGKNGQLESEANGQLHWISALGFELHDRGSLSGFAPLGSSNSVRPYDEDGSRSLVPLRGLFTFDFLEKSLPQTERKFWSLNVFFAFKICHFVSILDKQDLREERMMYIPYLYARNMIAKMEDDMSVLKRNHSSIISEVKVVYKDIEKESEVSPSDRCIDIVIRTYTEQFSFRNNSPPSWLKSVTITWRKLKPTKPWLVLCGAVLKGRIPSTSS